MSLITLGAKLPGEPSAGNRHARFDVAGIGNQLKVRLVRHSQRKRGATDRPRLRSRAPVPDPTVLYEMLTGVAAFAGDTISDSLAAVLTREPDWSALPSDAPIELRHLLHDSLARDPKSRLRDIGDARIQIVRLAGSGAGVMKPPTSSDAAPIVATSRVARALPWVLAGVLTAVLADVLVLWAPWRPAAPTPLTRFSTDIGVDLALDTRIGPAAIISPNGRIVVLTALGTTGPRLFVRRLDQLQATPLAGTEGANNPFFSPDGQWVAFFAAGKLKKTSITGGAAVTLCDASSGRGGTWADDGTIYFQPGIAPGPLMRILESGGTPEPLGPVTAGELVPRWPYVLPGGRALLYTGVDPRIGFEAADLMIQPLPRGAPKLVLHGGFHGRYVPSGLGSPTRAERERGHIVYMHEGTLFAVPFDPFTLEVIGRPAPVLEGLLSSDSNGGAQFSVSDAGTLVYSPRKELNRRAMFWMDSTGATTSLPIVEADWRQPTFSPDGQRIAFTIDDGSQQDVWLYDWARDTRTKFTFNPRNDNSAVWTPDGRRIVFASARPTGVMNLYWQRADGAGDVQQLTESPNHQAPYSFHPSGKYLAFTEVTLKNQGDLMILPLEGDEAKGWKPGKPTSFLSTAANEFSPMFSPDGQWIAYVSDESGQQQTYVRPFQGPGGKQLISVGLGVFPVWSIARHELFFQDPAVNKIMVAAYTTEGASFHADKPRLWSPSGYLPLVQGRVYDVHPDGKRVVISKPSDAAGERRDNVVLVFNFFDELRRIAPATTR
jgi:Tol biopolymer transport system component